MQWMGICAHNYTVELVEEGAESLEIGLWRQIMTLWCHD